MKQLLFICILSLLVTSGRAWSPIALSQDKSEISPNGRTFTDDEATDPDFLDGICFLPVKFIKQEGVELKAEFPSNSTAVVRKFQLLPNNRGLFLKLDKTIEQQIDREQFLKIFKKDLWLVAYRPVEGINYIYETHQIKNLEDLAPAYAFDPNDRYRRVTNYPFWNVLKVLPVRFYNLDRSSNRASWAFVTPIDPGRKPALYSSLVTLKHNYDQAYEKLKKSSQSDQSVMVDDMAKELGVPLEQIFILFDDQKFHSKILYDGTNLGVIARQGTFEISDYCVFSIKMANSPEKIVDRNFFDANYNQYTWVVFYNSVATPRHALRMVALSNEESK